MSVTANADDNTLFDQQNPTASFLDQLLSPPAPLRAAAAEIANIDQRSLLSISASDAVSGVRWAFASQQTDRSTPPLPFADGNQQLRQWMMNTARRAGDLQVSAVMPLAAATQSPTETVTRAINSRETSQYLEQNSDVVTLLAQLLGWQQTGLLPSVADLQKMASSHVGAVSSSIERWALQNVSFSSSTQAITGADTEQPMLQWQWSITTNSHQYNNSKNLADNEANFSANLRRLFGMNDYY